MKSRSAETASAADVLTAAGGAQLMGSTRTDVAAKRETLRRGRLWRLALALGLPTALLWWRIAAGHPVDLLQLPHVDPLTLFLLIMIVVLPGAMIGPLFFFGRSPHVLYRPEQIDVRLDDVVGISPVKDEVVSSLNLFLAHKTFAAEMGGTPRRGLLFEGSPGTGKTHMAKAMAAEAGVPFLFVSGTSFQSMFYGATARQIRSYFKALRKTALREGGAIGFIEEIDAIALRRGGMAMTGKDAIAASSPASPYADVQCCGSVTAMPAVLSAPATTVMPFAGGEGASGVVNELLVQMQSFDAPSGAQKLWDKVAASLNLLLPIDRQIRRPVPTRPNVLIIAATNRADALDPALLRPGRFDRALTFELPDQKGRRQLLDYFFTKKAHHADLDDEEKRDALASITHGYSPVMLENLLDEALVNALRRGDRAMSWRDIERARIATTVGLGQPIGYTDHEMRLIATHEAGHATTAYLVAPTRRLEVLSIIKRREALGLLAHGDADEVYTRSRSELLSLIQIAMGGQVAEELFFGDVSTGPSGDLLYATNIAAQMVGAAGMTGTLVSFAAVQGSALNGTNIVGRVLGDSDGRTRVEELLQEQKVLVSGILDEHRHLVAALRDTLLERKELIGHEITDVLEAAAAEYRAAGGTGAPAVIDLREPSVPAQLTD